MQKHAIIKGPPPTSEEVAEMLGLSDADLARARAWADQVLTKKAPPRPPSPKVKPHRSSSAKARGAKN